MRKTILVTAVLVLSSSFLILYMVKTIKDHHNVSSYLTHSLDDYHGFLKSYPVTDEDITHATILMTFTPDLLLWDSTRLKPYLKNIRLVNTPHSVIVYYDNKSKGLINLQDVDFFDCYFSKPNIKYFEIKKVPHVIPPDDYVHFDLMVFKNYRRKEIPELSSAIKNFHLKILGFNGNLSLNVDVFLQIRKYKGTPIYNVIWKRENVTDDEIRKAFTLLNLNVLRYFKNEYDIMNIPLVIKSRDSTLSGEV